MKIAIINPWSVNSKAIGGTERFVMDLAEGLVKLKHEVDVYMFSGNNHIFNNVNYISIDLFGKDIIADEYMIEKSFGKFETELSYKELAKRLESIVDLERYDCIQLNSQLFLEAWKHKKRIFTIHTNPYEYELAWGKKSFEVMLNVMKEYRDDAKTYFIVPSKYYSNEYYNLTNCNMKYISHAIDINRIVTNINKNDIIHKYNLQKDTVKILVPNRLEPIQKQPMMVIEACSLLSEKQKNMIEIIFTGLDKQYEFIIKQLEENSQKNNLRIKILRVDEMSEVYKIADIVVSPSKSESFGYSALESLSLGIYSILNNIPTYNEFLENKFNGEIYNNSIFELKEKVSECLSSKKYINEGLKNKIEISKYKMDNFISNYLKIIE